MSGNKMRNKCTDRWNRYSGLFAVLLLLVLLPPVPTQAAELEGRRVVRVGYYTAPGFQEYDEDTDTYSGSSYEYLVALRQYTSWEYEFVHVSFAEGVQMLEDGELDLMNNVSWTEEREQYLGFSSYASGANYGCLIVDVDNPDYAYNDFEGYNTMRVGIIEKSIFRSYFDDFCAEHNIHPQVFSYKDDSFMSEALANGEIDARVVSSSYQDGSRVVARFAPMSYYFAVPSAEKELLTELNDAMVSIQTDMPNFTQTLEKRYERRVVERNVVLSASEKAYVKEHQTVTVAVSGAWYPIFYIDKNGDMAGPLAEIYRRIEQATGLTFQPVKYDCYEDSLQAVKTGEVDMIVEFAYDFVYADEWNVQLSDQVNGIEFYRVINDNSRGDEVHTIAFYGEPYLESQVRKKYGTDVAYVNYANVEEAVNAVLDGQADCTFVNYYTSLKFQNQGKYISLKYILIPSLEYDFGLGICNDADPSLKSLVGKGLHTIDSDTMENLFLNSALVDNKMDIQAQFYQNPALFITLFCIFAAALVFVAAAIIYSRRMRVKNEELQSARHAQTVFLSRMSHDMRTPMNGIMGLAELSEEEKDELVLRDNIKRIRESGDYLLSLINDTLDFQRIESGRLTLETEVVSIQSVLDGVLDIVRPAIEKKNQKFEVVNEQVDLGSYIRLDPVRFKQIFINLISNAIKFTPEDGRICLTFGVLGRTDSISHACISVSDTGIGMSEAFIQTGLFKAFSQENNQVSAQYAGSGLGLSIVKSLVELMGGHIEVKSQQGMGTTFTVYLDLERVEKKQADELQKQDQRLDEDRFACLAGKNILLVEDHPLNAEIAKRLLQKAGCTVEWAENGQLGVETFSRSEPGTFQAILMDIRMPVMDGLASAKAIRALDRADAKTIPIIAMTANAYDEDVQKCLEAGMNAHLAKPIEPEKFYGTLVSHITNK